MLTKPHDNWGPPFLQFVQFKIRKGVTNKDVAYYLAWPLQVRLYPQIFFFNYFPDFFLWIWKDNGAIQSHQRILGIKNRKTNLALRSSHLWPSLIGSAGHWLSQTAEKLLVPLPGIHQVFVTFWLWPSFHAKIYRLLRKAKRNYCSKLMLFT